MSVGSAGVDLRNLSFTMAQRVKAMLSPLEDVCRYREQRSEDFAAYDVKIGRKDAISFSIAIAPGGVNLQTEYFVIHEFPLTEAKFMEQLVDALLQGRMRRVARLSASGKVLAAKVFVFDSDGRLLYKNRRRAGAFAGWTKTARIERRRFVGYRPTE